MTTTKPSDGIQRFIDYLQTERGYSAHTVRAYVRDIEQFHDYLVLGPQSFERDEDEERPAPTLTALSRATRNDVRAFLGHVQTRGGTPKTSARKLASLRALYKYYVRQGVFQENPAQTLRSPKLARDLPDVLSIPEVTALLEAPDLNDPLGVRDRALMETLY